MLNRQASLGSKVAAVAGFVLVVSYFLPWIEVSTAGPARGAPLSVHYSGFEFAPLNRILDTLAWSGSWTLWLTPLAGLVCLALYALVRTRSRNAVVGAALVRLVLGIIAFAGVAKILALYLRPGAVDPAIHVQALYGAWLVVAAYIAILVSVVIDLFIRTGDPELPDPTPTT
jgi:hypothetical protein